jgi:basic amino acid/polyamine antiporter, APA family
MVDRAGSRSALRAASDVRVATPGESSLQPTLARVMGPFDLVAILINVVIGAGILGLPGKVFASLGVYSLAAWLLCGLIMALIALCFAEVASRFADTGGVYLYSTSAFGPSVGFLVGWLAWVSRLFSFATIGNLAVAYLGAFFPTLHAPLPRFLFITFVAVLITWFLVIGVRQSTLVNNGLTICKLILLVGFALVMLPLAHLHLDIGPLPPADHWQVSMQQMTYAFIGIEAPMINGGEMRNPRRDTPIALAAGLGIVTLIYLSIQLACMGSVPDLAHSQTPVIDAVRQQFGAVGANFIAFASVISMVGSMFAILLGGSRLPFAIAEQDQLPKPLRAIHPTFRTPHVAILVTCILAWLITLYMSFFGALAVTTFTRLVGYVATCGAVWVLRRRSGSTGSFKMPFAGAVTTIALLACLWLMASTSVSQLYGVVGIAATGIVIATIHRLFSARTA